MTVLSSALCQRQDGKLVGLLGDNSARKCSTALYTRESARKRQYGGHPRDRSGHLRPGRGSTLQEYLAELTERAPPASTCRSIPSRSGSCMSLRREPSASGSHSLVCSTWASLLSSVLWLVCHLQTWSGAYFQAWLSHAVCPQPSSTFQAPNRATLGLSSCSLGDPTYTGHSRSWLTTTAPFSGCAP